MPERPRRRPGRRLRLRSVSAAAAGRRGPVRHEEAAARRRAPRSSAPRAPAGPRVSRAPAAAPAPTPAPRRHRAPRLEGGRGGPGLRDAGDPDPERGAPRPGPAGAPGALQLAARLRRGAAARSLRLCRPAVPRASRRCPADKPRVLGLHRSFGSRAPAPRPRAPLRPFPLVVRPRSPPPALRPPIHSVRSLPSPPSCRGPLPRSLPVRTPLQSRGS